MERVKIFGFITKESNATIAYKSSLNILQLVIPCEINTKSQATFFVVTTTLSEVIGRMIFYEVTLASDTLGQQGTTQEHGCLGASISANSALFVHGVLKHT